MYYTSEVLSDRVRWTQSPSARLAYRAATAFLGGTTTYHHACFRPPSGRGPRLPTDVSEFASSSLHPFPPQRSVAPPAKWIRTGSHGRGELLLGGMTFVVQRHCLISCRWCVVRYGTQKDDRRRAGLCTTPHTDTVKDHRAVFVCAIVTLMIVSTSITQHFDIALDISLGNCAVI